MTGTLSMWTVYRNPKDYPGKCVARRHEVTAGVSTPTDDMFLANNLDTIREYLTEHMHMSFPMTRDPDDDPCIVETWL